MFNVQGELFSATAHSLQFRGGCPCVAKCPSQVCLILIGEKWDFEFVTVFHIDSEGVPLFGQK